MANQTVKSCGYQLRGIFQITLGFSEFDQQENTINGQIEGNGQHDPGNDLLGRARVLEPWLCIEGDREQQALECKKPGGSVVALGLNGELPAEDDQAQGPDTEDDPLVGGQMIHWRFPDAD